MNKLEESKGLEFRYVKRGVLYASLLCSLLLLGSLLGCTAGMFGDLGGPAEAEIVGNTYPAIDPANVQVKDLIPAGGDSVSPETVSHYEKSIKGNMVAQIKASASGYGDYLQKALDKLKNKAAGIGANLILITKKDYSSTGGIGTIEGSNGVTLTSDAYHTTK